MYGMLLLIPDATDAWIRYKNPSRNGFSPSFVHLLREALASNCTRVFCEALVQRATCEVGKTGRKGEHLGTAKLLTKG